MAPKNQTFVSIQYLRGIAALLVVLYHSCQMHDITFETGAAGVDIFFIISGFVMWVSTYKRSITFSAFMLRRIQRLAPLYWIVTYTTTILVLLKPQFFYQIALSRPNFLKSLFFIPYYNKHGEIWPIVLQGWTLNIEMFFYLLIALTLLLPRAYRFTAATCSIIALTLAHAYIPRHMALPYQWSDLMLLELLSGMWLGWAYTSNILRHNALGHILIIISLIGFTTAHITDTSFYTSRLIQFGLPAFALVVGCIMLELSQSVAKFRTLEFLGDASYSVYVWHNLFMVIASALLLRMNITHLPFVAIMELLLTVSASLIAYVLIEKPITAAFTRKRNLTRAAHQTA